MEVVNLKDGLVRVKDEEPAAVGDEQGERQREETTKDREQLKRGGKSGGEGEGHGRGGGFSGLVVWGFLLSFLFFLFSEKKPIRIGPETEKNSPSFSP